MASLQVRDEIVHELCLDVELDVGGTVGSEEAGRNQGRRIRG
jgi:hypothetical protein